MPKQDTNLPDRPLRETEEAAYHAFREWPIFLVLKQKQLLAAQSKTETPSQTAEPKVQP